MPIAHVNSFMSRALNELGRSPCILAGDKQFHKDMAMREAQKVSCANGVTARDRAQARCVAHLIASLGVREDPAGGSDDPS